MAQDNTGGAAGLRPGIELLKTRWGPMYAFANDRGISEALRRFGEYGALEAMLYRRLLSPGDTFVDVGCNIGAITRAVASEPPHPRVIAFEPQPDCYRLASANALPHDNVTVCPLAVSDRAGLTSVDEFDIRRPGNYGGLGIDARREGHQRLPCPVVRLDEFLGPRAPHPRLIKIDVEGMEAAVLRGLAGLVHDRLVVSAEADRRPQVADTLRELQALGCRCHVALFRVIPPDNPNFDPRHLHCHTIHPHLLGFAGPQPAWIAQVKGIWPVETVADFEAVVDGHLKGGASPA